jgi:hypothetical protein
MEQTLTETMPDQAIEKLPDFMPGERNDKMFDKTPENILSEKGTDKRVLKKIDDLINRPIDDLIDRAIVDLIDREIDKVPDKVAGGPYNKRDPDPDEDEAVPFKMSPIRVAVEPVEHIKWALDGNTHCLHKLLWASIMVGSTCLAIYSSMTIYLSWQAAPVMTTFGSDILPIHDLEFPSVILCRDRFYKTPFRQKTCWDKFSPSNFHSQTTYVNLAE